MKEKFCKYSKDTPAEYSCYECEAPLCEHCGFSMGMKMFCNECYHKVHPEEFK